MSTCVNCPTCGAKVEWNDQQPWRPFCSERCRLIDLGKWA
ncbi:MAG: DNA gyrase inhibitor YacG, partial [Gammaproteobacteria bacterium]